MGTISKLLMMSLAAFSVVAQSMPRFEDYPVADQWHGISAPVKLTTPSERMFRTRLTEASKEPPNFEAIRAASHFQDCLIQDDHGR